MKKIKTFNDACKALKLKPTLPNVSALPKKHQKALLAHYQLIIIAEALNEGWQPNWNNGESKYYPWFEIKANEKNPSGFGFSTTHCVYWRTLADVGSRLCFKSNKLALYAGKQFEKLYKDYLLITK